MRMRLIGTVVMILLVGLAVAGDDDTATTRPAEGSAPTLTLEAALGKALADERHARAFYVAVMAKHGERRPFSNVVRAERRHEAALIEQYERLGLTPPKDEVTVAPDDVPATFREACDAAVFAEILNARLYDDLLVAVEDEEVLRVFRALRAASIERHLPAFRRHGSGWRVLDEAPSPAQAAQIARAKASRDDLFGRLVQRLVGAMREKGPAGAITVCREEAPGIAADVARERTVAIGRTSWKLRNPNNTGPGWTALVLPDRPEAERVVVDRRGRLGWIAPIRVGDACLACHGPRDSIVPEVIERLDALYPKDQATGFASGDLRGWFWVEVPGDVAEAGPGSGRGPGPGPGRGPGRGRGPGLGPGPGPGPGLGPGPGPGLGPGPGPGQGRGPVQGPGR